MFCNACCGALSMDGTFLRDGMVTRKGTINNNSTNKMEGWQSNYPFRRPYIRVGGEGWVSFFLFNVHCINPLFDPIFCQAQNDENKVPKLFGIVSTEIVQLLKLEFSNSCVSVQVSLGIM